MSSPDPLDTSISNILLPAMDSLEIGRDRPKSPDSSSCSNESYCSLEVVGNSNLPPHITSDELPIFSIRSLSPSGRSLSPVVADQMCISPVDCPDFDADFTDDILMEDGRVLLSDIRALIETPDEVNERHLNLETIFEDVFLETPLKRKKHSDLQQYERKRLSFDSIHRYVRDQQQFSYCNGNYNLIKMNQNKENKL